MTASKSNLKGKAHLTKSGKDLRNKIMFRKGKSFIKAALLLRKSHDCETVASHLLLQGLEVILKSLLLHKGTTMQEIKKIGHDLLKLINTDHLRNIFHFEDELISEIKVINVLYKKHHLRYGSGIDLIIDLKISKAELFFKKLIEIIKYSEEQLFNI